VRLVLQQPPEETTTAPDVLHVSSSPHALVFPRCAAVVHHGGAGTTQMPVRAQVPSVVVPHLADQFFWAAQLERLGVGGPRRRAVKLLQYHSLRRSLAHSQTPRSVQPQRGSARRWKTKMALQPRSLFVNHWADVEWLVR
jgi:sterol 3beta-glucosyltransferase